MAIDFEQQIVAGTTLIREAIQSQNFLPGTSGWIIEANGDAEFNSITVRGRFIVGDETSQHIVIELDPVFPFRPTISLSTGAGPGVEAGPARIYSSDPSQPQLALILEAPAAVGGLGGAQIFMATEAGLPSRIGFIAGEMSFLGLANPPISDLPFLVDQAWQNVTLAGTWVVGGGFTPGYFKDISGRVQLRGQVVGGGAVSIMTLPAGYRPSQTMEWVMRAVGGVTMCAITVNTAGLVSLTANAAAAQATGVKLDSISFPSVF